MHIGASPSRGEELVCEDATAPRSFSTHSSINMFARNMEKGNGQLYMAEKNVKESGEAGSTLETLEAMESRPGAVVANSIR